MYKIKLFTASICLILFVSFVANSQQANNSEMAKISNKFFNYLKNDYYSEAADLFHYPNEYSNEELQKDKFYMKETLRLCKKEFGEITSIKAITQSPGSVNFSLRGGDFNYWKKYPYFVAQIFQVQFENEGLGFIFMRFCNIKDTLEIRSISYGIPKSRSGAEERINEILSKMLKIVSKIKFPSDT
jgi:hypothetical protein